LTHHSQTQRLKPNKLSCWEFEIELYLLVIKRSLLENYQKSPCWGASELNRRFFPGTP
jgi:hypothetical protein